MATEKGLDVKMDCRGISPKLKKYFQDCIAFHTYPAPGLLIGVFMTDYAIELLGAAPGEKLYAVSETNKCLPDPLQIILHCTTGNHRLRVIPTGRFAVTVNRPSVEPLTKGVRVFLDPNRVNKYPILKAWFTNDPSFNQKSQGGNLVDEILKAGREILSFEKIQVKVTPKQKWRSAQCEVCGEMVPEDLLIQGVCRGCGSMAYFIREK
jgi:formylmethanofuran dehydrogenase subunit E